MSTVFGLSSPNGFTLQKFQNSGITCFAATSGLGSPVTGRSICEVKVSKGLDKELPIPIKLVTRKITEDAKSPKSFRSTVISPMVSPRSQASTRTNIYSPKSLKFLESPKETLKHIFTFPDTSHKQDISDLLKNTLRIHSQQSKQQRIKIERDAKSRIEKKTQMKLLDKIIRDDNFYKFKQKSVLFRPKWGIDDKRVISETKALRELEKSKKTVKEKKSALSFDSNRTPLRRKKKHAKKKYQTPKQITQESEENLSAHKQEIYQKLVDLNNRVNILRNNTSLGIKVQGLVKGYIDRKFFSEEVKIQKKIEEAREEKKNQELKPLKVRSNYEEEDFEVQSIMKSKPKLTIEKLEKSLEENKDSRDYEKLLASQMKLKMHQQEQLKDLRAKDLNEMIKLADVLGGTQEMKEKFAVMIERRYSKLNHLFDENIESMRQVICGEEPNEINFLQMLAENQAKHLPGSRKNSTKEFAGSRKNSTKEQMSPYDEYPLPSLRGTISEFSSSFLMQLKEVPGALPIEMTVEPDSDHGDDEYIDSPSEESLYSRDTLEEQFDDCVKFPKLVHHLSQPESQDEPNLPLISDSFSDTQDLINQEKSEEGALENLVREIKDTNKSSSNEEESDNTLKLSDPHAPVIEKSPIFIKDESFSSNESGIINEYSSIVATPAAEPNIEFPSAEHSFKKPLRNIFETFPHKEPSPFTASIETSTETDGFELIINRVLFTLELHIFSIFYEEILNDSDFLNNLSTTSSKKSKIPVKGINSLLLPENQVQTDQIAVLSFIKKLQALKPPDEVLRKIMSIFDPFQMLSRIQENYDELDEEVQIFDYSDLEKVECSCNLSISLSLSSSGVNPYIQTHNKMILDVLNEAILRSAKNKVPLPWKIQDQADVLSYDSIMKSAIKKVLKWCEMQAGKVPCSDMINSKGDLDEDKLQNIREDKLSQFLTLDVEEADQCWIDCDFEESQVAVDLADYIMSELFDETLKLVKIFRVKL